MSRRATFPIVGIGSSAGGLEPLGLFLDHVRQSGMAFVLVPHLHPTLPSHIVDLLARHTSMDVVTATDGAEVERDKVYVIPPNRYLTIRDGKLLLAEPTEPRGQRRPVDVFFHSLGRDQRDRAIAVVLSGTGSNGASGLRTVKAEGGFVLAQDPATAAYPGMPMAAIATGLVDDVAPPQDLPEIIERVGRHPYMSQPNAELVADSRHVSALLGVVRDRTRHDFRAYKRSTVLRRVHRRMGLRGIEQVAAYVDVLLQDEPEVKALARDLMITVTGFFRDTDAWSVLRDKVIRPLVASQSRDDPIRVWVPGCATGEEAYSIALLLVDAMTETGRFLGVKIFATDTAVEGIEFARRGVYPASVVADVPPELLNRYFAGEDDSYRLKQHVRDLVVFASHNVLQDPPFTQLDLVSCRNLLIYIAPEVQQRLLGLFHHVLRADGHLFLGTAETVSSAPELFEAVSKKWRIYRRSAGVERSHFGLPVVGQMSDVSGLTDGTLRRSRGTRLAEVAREALLSQFTPAAVLVDRRMRVHYFHGEISQFLRQPAGEPTADLLSLARANLRGRLRAAVLRAIETGHPVSDELAVTQGRSTGNVRINVLPRLAGSDDGELLIVTFEHRDGARSVEPTTLPEEADVGDGVEELRAENRALREELRGTIEQMDTSNEELRASNEEVMSVNEELQSANEELEVSKEELQSINEELNTVNAQLQAKLEELESRTNDLNNILRSTNVATLFLDGQRRIRWFTPAMRELMRLVPADVGRPLDQLADWFTGGDVAGDVESVLELQEPARREVQSTDGRWFERRTVAYHTDDDRINGVVITFIDVTESKLAEERVRAQRDFAERVVNSVQDSLVLLRYDLVVDSVNDSFCHTFGIDRDEVVGRPFLDIQGGVWRTPPVPDRLRTAASDHPDAGATELDHDFPVVGHRVVEMRAQRLESMQVILLAIGDVTDRRAAERQRSLLVAELNHRVKNVLMKVRAVASQTLDGSVSAADFRERFEGRIDALARGHDLVVQVGWEPVPLDALLDLAVRPYAGARPDQVRGGCPELLIQPGAALGFDLALHELATNAARHGALSSSDGHVEIACKVDGRPDGLAELTWRECGGPELDGPPARRGFGLELIEMIAQHELDGDAAFEFRREGLYCSLTFARSHLAMDGS